MDQIQVVSRNAIPPIQAIEQGGVTQELGELRDFRWNALLREFMPVSPGFSVSWVRLERGEVLELQANDVASLMIFYAGSGTMLGDLEGPVVKDDVAVIPSGCKHGFVAGPEGLQGLSIQLGDALYANSPVELPDPEHSLSGLLAYNHKRLQELKRRPLFELLADGTLGDPLKRRSFSDAVRIWLDGSQLFQEPSEHAPNTASGSDTSLEAMTTWFAHQLFVLDSVEKAALELVVQQATAACHAAVAPVIAQYPDVPSRLFAQARQSRLGEDQLAHQSARTYARLRVIVAEAWDMLSAITDRVAELTLRA